MLQMNLLFNIFVEKSGWEEYIEHSQNNLVYHGLKPVKYSLPLMCLVTKAEL
jgi:hypothetical protein